MSTVSRAKMDQREASTDRISDLPANVIDKIMLYLPLLDAARMSVLSKKWRSNWVSLPYLIFDYEFAKTVLANGDYNAYKWSRIITNILLLHEGSIIEFSLTFPCSISALYPDFSSWISLVSSKGVKTLTLFNEGGPLITVPSQLFFCAGLEDLALWEFTIDHLPCFTGFRNLLDLDLCDVVFEDVIFRDFMACFPVLEILTLTCCRILDPVVIDLPNLKNRTFNGAYECISFKNAPNLLSLSLYSVVDEGIIKGAVEMIKFLVSSCKLQRLCICPGFCEVLANSGISTILPTTFKQLKILKLSIDKDRMNGFLCGFGIVRSCLNIEELEITFPVYQRSPSKEELNNLHGETDSAELQHFNNEPESAFKHLRSIYISCIGPITVELKLVSYLLASSPSLMRLSFTCKWRLKAAAKSLLYIRMLQFKRASPTAEIVNRDREVWAEG